MVKGVLQAVTVSGNGGNGVSDMVQGMFNFNQSGVPVRWAGSFNTSWNRRNSLEVKRWLISY